MKIKNYAMLKEQEEIANKLEEKRKSKHGITLLCGIGGIVFVVVGIVCFILGGNFSQFLPMIGFITIFLGMLIIGYSVKLKTSFQKEARSMLTEAVSKSIFKGSEFDPKGGFSESEVLAPGFFAKCERFSSSDFLHAEYDGVLFDQCHFVLQKRNHNGKNSNSWMTYGQGTIYRFYVSKGFSGRLKVMEKATMKNQSGLDGTQYINYGDSSLSKIETEYIAFNKKFETLASDKTLAFYLLTPQMQEKIMSFEGKFEGSFFLALKSPYLYIVVNNSDASFKIPTNKPITPETLNPIIELLSIPSVIIDEMHLDSHKYQGNKD